MITTIAIGIIAVLGCVVAIMFGRALWQSICAIFRLVGHTMLAMGWYVVGMFFMVAVAVSWMTYVYWYKTGDMRAARLRPLVCTEVYGDASNSTQVTDYNCPFKGVRIWRSLSSIDSKLRMLVVMLEDDKFYEHDGLDFDEIANAVEHDLEKKKLARGASTITQQLAKNLFLTKEKSFLRKLSEVPLVMRLEKKLTKTQILELYLNTIEWGPGVYGAEAAARLYFDHEASTLSTPEAWLLALMIPNPKELNLWISPKAEKSLVKRATRLAARLFAEHHMSKAQSDAALTEFKEFISTWRTKKPTDYRQGRKFPARWSP